MATIIADRPSNDTASGALTLTLPATISADTTEASTDEDDDAITAQCGLEVPPSRSVWGFAVRTGGPGSLLVEVCGGPSPVADFGTSADTTYYMMFYDASGLGAGGQLSATLTELPAPDGSATIAPTGKISKDGAAIVEGTITCSAATYLQAISPNGKFSGGKADVTLALYFRELVCVFRSAEAAIKLNGHS